MNPFQRLYQWVDAQLHKLVAERDQALVRIIDLWWTDCPYCLAYRSLAIGAAAGLAVGQFWYASGALLLPVVLLRILQLLGEKKA